VSSGCGGCVRSFPRRPRWAEFRSNWFVDVDGTLAETEETHRQAFNEAFARAASTGAGLPNFTASYCR